MIFIKRKFIFWGSIIIFLLGSLLHFTYDWSNNNCLVGVFSSTSESIFEHTKLLVYPTIIYYIIYYYRYKRLINKDKYFGSLVFSLVFGIFIIPTLFYLFRYGFGIEYLIVDLVIFYLASLFGLIFGMHYYKYGKKIFSYRLWLIIILLFYAYATFYPLNLPIFIA